MEFTHTIPEWKNAGIEPSNAWKQSGYSAGDSPGADTFNWFLSKFGKSVTELQNKLSSTDTAKVDKDGLPEYLSTLGISRVASGSYIGDASGSVTFNCSVTGNYWDTSSTTSSYYIEAEVGSVVSRNPRIISLPFEANVLLLFDKTTNEMIILYKGDSITAYYVVTSLDGAVSTSDGSGTLTDHEEVSSIGSFGLTVFTGSALEHVCGATFNETLGENITSAEVEFVKFTNANNVDGDAANGYNAAGRTYYYLAF